MFMPYHKLILLKRSFDSKRIDAQLQEIEQKSEKKKMEVLVFIIFKLHRHSSLIVGRITDRITTAPEAGWVQWTCSICIVANYN